MSTLTLAQLDGAVHGLLPKLAAVCFDAIEAVTPHPCGDVTVDDQVLPNGTIEFVRQIGEMIRHG